LSVAGDIVGVGVGAGVAVAVGVGVTVGVAVGPDVGTVVGTPVGLEVGDVDGEAVGVGVGDGEVLELLEYKYAPAPIAATIIMIATTAIMIFIVEFISFPQLAFIDKRSNIVPLHRI